MELIDHLRLLGRRWTWLLFGLLLGGSAAAGWAYVTPPTYSTSTELFVGSVLSDQNASGGGSYSASQFVLGRMSTYAQLVDSPDIAQRVEARLQIGLSPADFADAVTATVPPGTVLLRVNATATDPVEAQLLADATADALATTIEDLERSTAGDRDVVDAKITSPATAPTRPSAPDIPMGIGIGVALGLLLGLLGATARDQAVRRRTLALSDRETVRVDGPGDDDQESTPSHLVGRR